MRRLSRSEKKQLDRRYPENWAEISKITRRMTGYMCCFPGCKSKATCSHHAFYQFKGRDITKSPYPGIVTFGLCDRHHCDRSNPECAHNPANWISGTKAKKFLDARNNAEYYRAIVQGFREKLLSQYR